MGRQSLRKYISNPVLGLIPFILYLVLHAMGGMRDLHSITLSLIVAVVMELCIRLRFKTKMYSLTLFTSIIALLSTFLFGAITHGFMHSLSVYVIFCEVMVITSLLLIRLSKIYIGTLFFREKSVLQKAWFNEFYHIASMIQYSLMVHLFFVLIYLNFRVIGAAYTHFDIFVVILVPIILLVVIGIYTLVRTTSFVSRLREEEWLPVVTEKGEVTGKIAKSVSMKMKNRFLHPVVRVALVSHGKVYMQERKAGSIIDAGKLDYPFEKYMLFNHEINLAARNSISQMMGDNDLPLKFLLKYVLENEETKRLVLLFIATIEDESKIKRTGRMKGKFWTIKQIEECFADEVFSESFVLEFEYLKNTVLMLDEN